MQVVVTGASGTIGRRLVSELERRSHEVRPLDRYRLPGRLGPRTDLASRHPWLERLPGPRWLTPWWPRALEGADAIVHLAADPNVDAPLASVRRNNFRATWNVFEAASGRGVPRVVFGSSCQVVKGTVDRLAPGCFRADGPKLGSDAPAEPTSPYGASKAFGEDLGRRLVEAGALESFVAVRIGIFSPSPREETALRSRWVAPSDLVRLLWRCVVADLEGAHTVYGVSRQETAPYDLGYTREALGWEPEVHPDAAVDEDAGP